MERRNEKDGGGRAGVRGGMAAGSRAANAAEPVPNVLCSVDFYTLLTPIVSN